MAYSDPKSQMLHSLISSSEKHAVADQTVLPSTRPICPRWRPPQRRARSGPPHGHSAPPLSWFQQRGVGMTSCCSSSFAARRPPTAGRRLPLLRWGQRQLLINLEANVCGCRWWCWKQKKKNQVISLWGRSNYSCKSWKKCDLLRSSSGLIPIGQRKAPSFNTLHFPAAGGRGGLNLCCKSSQQSFRPWQVLKGEVVVVVAERWTTFLNPVRFFFVCEWRPAKVERPSFEN